MEQPVDLEAVRADDDLIEALAAGLVKPPVRRPNAGDVDEQLVALLSSWVADVRPETLLHRPADTWAALDRPARIGSRSAGRTQAEPAAAPLDVDEEAGFPGPANDDVAAGTPDELAALPVALPLAICGADMDGGDIGHADGGDSDGGDSDDAVDTERIPRLVPIRGRRQLRPLHRFAAAAAFIALAGSGLVLSAWDAKPGTALWPVTRVVFAEKARSVQAAVDVVGNLTRARDAFNAHDVAEAKSAYQDAIDQLAAVGPAEGQAALVQETSAIALQLGLPTQTDVVNSDNRNVLASGEVGATSGNASAPTTDPDADLVASGATAGPAADVTVAAGIPEPVAAAATAIKKPSADDPGSSRATPDPTINTAAPTPTTDAAPTSADPTSTDPTSAGPTSAGPPSTDPVSPGPSNSGSSGTQTIGSGTTGSGATDTTGSDTTGSDTTGSDGAAPTGSGNAGPDAPAGSDS